MISKITYIVSATIISTLLYLTTLNFNYLNINSKNIDNNITISKDYIDNNLINENNQSQKIELSEIENNLINENNQSQKIELSEIENKKIKQFTAKLLPIIDKVNIKIEKDRKILLSNNTKDFKIKKELEKKYKISNIKDNKEILLKTQSIDPVLTIAQAGIESGNGTSFYAKQYNNLFGIYKQRSERKKVIQKFDNLEESVTRYAEVLNTNSYYQKYREYKFSNEDINYKKLIETFDKFYCENKNYKTLLIGYIKNLI